MEGEAFDVSQAGPFGTLFVNSANGDFTFVPDNDAINALTEPAAANFTVTVSDGTLSADQTFTIAINGTNDAAVIPATPPARRSRPAAAGDVNILSAPLTATGTLTNTDVDNPPDTFAAVTSPTPSNAGYGTFTMTAAGVWVYTVDNSNHAVQALNVGDTLTDTFTVTTVDGTPQLVRSSSTAPTTPPSFPATRPARSSRTAAPSTARRPQPASSPIPMSTIRPIVSQRSTHRRQVPAATAPSR